MKLGNARLLITGGASGIGHHLVSQLASEVQSVAMIDIDQKKMETMQIASNVSKFVCDVTDAAQVEQTIKNISEQGGVNVLINCAGIIHSEPLINLLSRGDRKHNLASWSKVINTNLNAVFLVTSHVVDDLVRRKEGGVIVNISSIAAKGNVGQSAYSAAKAGVEALTRTWSKELAMFKIRSACIAPGFFDTPSTRAGLSEHMLEKWRKQVPLGRLGTLDEILGGVRFIIENDYFSGKTIELDGGLNL